MLALLDFAERLLEDVYRQGVTSVVEGSVLSHGCISISNYSALSHFVVNGGNKSVILREQLLSTLGLVGGISLSHDTNVSVGVFYDYLPPEVRTPELKNKELWIVGCLVSRASQYSTKSLPRLPSEHNVYFPPDTPIQNHYQWIRDLPSCKVSVHFDESAEDYSDKFLLVFHGLDDLLDANRIAKIAGKNLRGQNYIGLCSTDSIDTIMPYQIEDKYALVAGTMKLPLGLK